MSLGCSNFALQLLVADHPWVLQSQQSSSEGRGYLNILQCTQMRLAALIEGMTNLTSTVADETAGAIDASGVKIVADIGGAPKVRCSRRCSDLHLLKHVLHVACIRIFKNCRCALCPVGES